MPLLKPCVQLIPVPQHVETVRSNDSETQRLQSLFSGVVGAVLASLAVGPPIELSDQTGIRVE